MISYLIGIPRFDGEELTVLVHDVGYQVVVGPTALSRLSSQDQVLLYIHTHVKEDVLELYGFETSLKKKVFKLLLKVSGVGPRTAITIVDGQPEKVAQAVQQAQTAFFTAVPRVGKKLAQKIIIELRSKLGEMKELDLSPKSSEYLQVEEALLSLGFNQQAIDQVLADLEIEIGGIEAALKQAIQQLGKSKD